MCLAKPEKELNSKGPIAMMNLSTEWYGPRSPFRSVVDFISLKHNLRNFSASNSHSAIRNLTSNLMKIMVNSIYQSHIWSEVTVLGAQLCPTLWDPMDCRPWGSSVHGILQAKHWSGLLWFPPGDLPNPGIKSVSLMSPALAGGFFTASATWEAHCVCVYTHIHT